MTVEDARDALEERGVRSVDDEAVQTALRAAKVAFRIWGIRGLALQISRKKKIVCLVL